MEVRPPTELLTLCRCKGATIPAAELEDELDSDKDTAMELAWVREDIVDCVCVCV